MPVARHLVRSTRDLGRAAPGRRGVRPCSTLLRAGFTWPAGHPTAGGLLPHHFTVAAAAPRLCHFCGTLLRVAPTGRYPAPCSVEPGLSSDDERPRPSGRLARRFYRRLACAAAPHGPPPDAPPPWRNRGSSPAPPTSTSVRIDALSSDCYGSAIQWGVVVNSGARNVR